MRAPAVRINAVSTDGELPGVADDPLEYILQLADAERRARNSAQWKTDLEDACEAHGAAADRLYDTLYRMLDERAIVGRPVPKLRAPPDHRKELKRELTARLKEELPTLIATILDEF